MRSRVLTWPPKIWGSGRGPRQQQEAQEAELWLRRENDVNTLSNPDVRSMACHRNDAFPKNLNLIVTLILKPRYLETIASSSYCYRYKPCCFQTPHPPPSRSKFLGFNRTNRFSVLAPSVFARNSEKFSCVCIWRTAASALCSVL